MMIHKAFALLAISYLSTASAYNLDNVLNSSNGNGNFIIQLNQTACIKHFVPQFIDNAFEVFAQSIGNDHLAKRGNRIVRRDTEEDQVHVFDAYDIGDSFKGITVSFESLDIVKGLVESFKSHEIVQIIPDEDFTFDLPTSPKTVHQKRKMVARAAASQRVGNFDLDEYEHDKDCPYAHEHSGHHSLSKRSSSNKKTSKKNYHSKKVSKKSATKKTQKKTTHKSVKKSTKKSFKKAAKKSTKHTTKHTTKKVVKKAATKSSKKNTKKTTKKNTKKTTKKTTKKATVKKAVQKTTKSAVATNNSGSNKSSSQYESQSDATWNLVRTSQHKRQLSDPYIYPSTAGSSAYVYVIDDGMKIDHDEFEGRASWGYSTYSGVSRLGEGHGTHVGGIIAGKTYGIAKKANLVAVQVLDESGSGSLSSLLAGIQWVNKQASKHKGKAIINMSLGLKTDGKLDSSLKAFDKAITAVVKAGVPVIAAAGNWGNDACDVLPAGNPNVLSVGAVDDTDKMGDYSSYGKCVSILAPGSKIKSSFIKSDSSTTTLTGTSMAAPHAAGVAALFVDKLGKPTPTALYKAIKSAGTKSAAKSVVSNTPNLLLFNGQASS